MKDKNISNFLEAFKNQDVNIDTLKEYIKTYKNINTNENENNQLLHNDLVSSLYVYAMQNYDLELMRFLLDNEVGLGVSASYDTCPILIWEVFYQLGRNDDDEPFSLRDYDMETNDNLLTHQLFAILMCGALMLTVDEYFYPDEEECLSKIPLLYVVNDPKIQPKYEYVKYNRNIHEYVKLDPDTNIKYSYYIDRLSWFVSNFSIFGNEFAPGKNELNVETNKAIAEIHSHIYNNIKNTIYNLNKQNKLLENKLRQETTKGVLSSYLNRNTSGLVTGYMNNINGGNKTRTIKNKKIQNKLKQIKTRRKRKKVKNKKK